MKKNLLLILFASLGVSVLIGCATNGNRVDYINKKVKLGKLQRIVLYDPEIFPNIPEIAEPTNLAYFSALTDEMKLLGDYTLLRVNNVPDYQFTEIKNLQEICKNNSADAVIIPKVKYFKVGFGKYVFSNQVIVSLKLYNSSGDFICETSYDTYKANARILGKAKNSLKIGTVGALQKMSQQLRSNKIITKKL